MPADVPELVGTRPLRVRTGDGVQVDGIVLPATAPTPLLLVHGDRDEHFPLEHFRVLARAAGPGATAWVVPGLGHAESSTSAPLVERSGRWASETIRG